MKKIACYSLLIIMAVMASTFCYSADSDHRKILRNKISVLIKDGPDRTCGWSCCFSRYDVDQIIRDLLQKSKFEKTCFQGRFIPPPGARVGPYDEYFKVIVEYNSSSNKVIGSLIWIGYDPEGSESDSFEYEIPAGEWNLMK
jgi:hypothetical protein